jgi:hypothetical protein
MVTSKIPKNFENKRAFKTKCRMYYLMGFSLRQQQTISNPLRSEKVYEVGSPTSLRVQLEEDFHNLPRMCHKTTATGVLRETHDRTSQIPSLIRAENNPVPVRIAKKRGMHQI